MNESRDTRQTLITTARKLFARQGYEGTSIKAITSAAHANLGAVTYHFATKYKLYEEVLRSVIGPLLDEVRRATSGDGTPMDRIESGLRAYFEYMHAHPEGPSMMLHELSLNRKIPAPIRESIAPLLALIAGLIQEGQRDGSITAGDPILLTLSTIAQPAYLLIVRRPLREIAGLDMLDRPERERVLDHLVAFVRRGLANTNGGHR